MAIADRRRRGLGDVSALRVSELSAAAEVDEVEEWNLETGVAVAAAEAELAEAEGRERREGLRRVLAAAASGSAVASVRSRAEAAIRRVETARRQHVPEPTPVVDHLDREAEIAALIERLPVGASKQEQELMESRLSTLASAPAARFRSQMISAKADFQFIEREIMDRVEMRRRAERLLETLDGLEGSEVDASRALLLRVAKGETPLLDSDVEAVVRAREAGAADYERRFVASKIEAAFRDCGFEVGSGFATDVFSGEEAYLGSSSDEHAVGVRLREGLVDLRLVRAEGVPDTRSDIDAEIAFCKDVGRVSAELYSRGVELELVSHQPPGAVDVEMVHAAKSALRPRSRHRSQARKRRLPR